MGLNVKPKAKKVKKPQLAELPHEELLTYTRKLRGEKADLKDQLATLETRVAELELSERALRSRNVELESLLETAEQEIEAMKQELERAADNNTKLQGVIESAGEGDNLSNSTALSAIIRRLDVLIIQGGGEPPNDGESDLPPDEDDFDDEAGPRVISGDSDDRDFADDEDEDSDDEDEGEEQEPAEVTSLHTFQPEQAQEEHGGPGPVILLPEDHSTAPIHGADVAVSAVEAALNPPAEAAKPTISEDELSAAIIPNIKATVDNYEGYEDVIIGAVNSGNLTKEMALRTVVQKAYPDFPEIAETVLGTPSTRDKVYEVMGL